ncbi:glycosyltransferase [Paenibacillus timonensis]|nr:glycosyltransferase [Paenibacillus timonensis]MUG89181.1 glycosyltransferase [Paenibacillus timonensis]
MDFTGERFVPGKTDKELEIEHLQRYEMLREIVKGKRVLDAACGEGYGSFILSQHAFSVTGIDVSSESIANAQSKYKNIQLDYIVASIERLPFDDGSFDIVVSFETLEHVDEAIQQRFMSEVRRVLSPDGALIISTPNKKYYSDLSDYHNEFHIKELYKDEFKQLLHQYFKHVNLLSQRFEVVSMIDSNDVAPGSYLDITPASHQDEAEKYMIAFCSNQAEQAKPVYSLMRYKNRYDSLLSRLLIVQEEVEERNDHIRTLDNEIEMTRTRILQLQDEVEERNRHILILDREMESRHTDEIVLQSIDRLQTELSRKIEELHRISNKNQENELKLSKLSSQIENLQTELRNKTGHIELLLTKERELNNIYGSTGWKLLLLFYKIRDFIIPAKSKRRILAKLVLSTFRHPRLMLSKLSKDNLKKLNYYFSTDDKGRLEDRLDAFVERHQDESGQKTPLKIFGRGEFSKLTFEQYEEPVVSIIIPVYNQWDYTYACLASILENTRDIPFEIIIADDMSTDETVNIDGYVENIVVVRDGVNRGFLLNCNNAAKVARGKYLFFLNNDTNVQQNWLSSLLELIETDSSIGMIGSKLVYPDGRQQESGGIIWNDASGWNYGRLDDPEKPEYNYVKDVDYISGAAILVRKNLWDKLGGFDERYVPAYFEDTDLAFEIRRLGYRVVLQPKSVIVHFEGVSHGTDTGSGIKSYQIKNKEKFRDKWQEELSVNHFPNAEHVYWARDRSGKQKTVVVVDHYVPHYDKDAGGRCTYFYIKLMKSMGLHVIFIGDNFFKHEPYTTELQQMGVEVLYGNEYAKNIHQWIKADGQYLDYVYLNRPHIAIKYMDSFKKNTKAKIIYFGHDLHYLREMRNYEITKNPVLLKSAEEWKKTEFTLFEQADVIHVVGSFEQKVLQEQFPDKPVRNIPLFPYEEQYDQRAPQYQERKDLLFVGGFNHTPNYDGITWFINDIFPHIKKALPEIRLYIVGSNPPEELKAMQSESIIITGYVSDEELENYYKKCRIIVVPLRYGAGVKGKVVEALYYQVPVITTSIGSEGLVNTENVMMVADDSEQFANSVIHLYEDETQWSSLSRLSGEYIGQYFTREAAQKILALDINEK